MPIRGNSIIPDKPAARLLRERDLAVRWQTSQRTLQRWRAHGTGPAYILIGGAIRYSLADVAAFEDRMRRNGEKP